MINIFVGLDATGKPIYKDLEKDIHLLVAGATGTGKSNTLHNIIKHINSHIILCDPKYTELIRWRDSTKVINKTIYNDLDDIDKILKVMNKYTLDRFAKMQAINVYDYKTYEKQTGEQLKPITIIVDECHILHGKSKKCLTNIATLGRAANIHLILATQKPSATAFPTVIREQSLGRMSHFVASKSSSNMILNEPSAYTLPYGQGELFYKHIGDKKEFYKMPLYQEATKIKYY